MRVVINRSFDSFCRACKTFLTEFVGHFLELVEIFGHFLDFLQLVEFCGHSLVIFWNFLELVKKVSKKLYLMRRR